MKKDIFALGILLLLVPFFVFAQGPPGAGTPPIVINPPIGVAPIMSGLQIVLFVNYILGWFATIFWIGAVIAIFYAAFLYLTAAGDESKVERASRTLLYAVIAVVVGVMAYGLPLLVESLLLGI